MIAACGRYAAAQVAYDGACSVAIHPQKIGYLTGRYDLACRVAASEPGVVFDAPAIDACAGKLAEWRKNACAHRPVVFASADPLQVCASVLAGAGSLPDGDSCTAGVQCASGVCLQGFVLEAAAGSSGAKAKSFKTCGNCAQPLHLGDACRLSTDPPRASAVDGACEAGTYCGGSCVGTDCDRMCVAAPKEGEECGNEQFACADGLSCRYLSIPQAFRCVKDRPAGATCAEQNECAPDLSCISHVCTPFSGVNSVCRVECEGTSVCVDGTCQPLTTVACRMHASVQ